MPPPTKHTRTLGALLGLHAGDSLGATLEFLPYSTIKSQHPSGLRDIIGGGCFKWPAGNATDDTDLTRACVLAYLSRHHAQSPGSKHPHKHDFDVVRATADNMVDWLEGRWPGRRIGSDPVDIGGATSKGLGKYVSSKDPRRSGAGRDSCGNGSLMRCIPSALFATSREERVRESWEIGAITHDDFRCRVACCVYNEIVAALVAGERWEDAVRRGREVTYEYDAAVVDAAIEEGMRVDLKKLADGGVEYWETDLTTGFVLNAITLSVAALRDGRGFEEVIVDVTRLGGDTDTNGAIVGGVMGARDGVEGIPRRWLEKLQFRREFEDAVRMLVPK